MAVFGLDKGQLQHGTTGRGHGPGLPTTWPWPGGGDGKVDGGTCPSTLHARNHGWRCLERRWRIEEHPSNVPGPATTKHTTNENLPTREKTNRLHHYLEANMLLQDKSEISRPSMEHTRRLFQAPLPRTPWTFDSVQGQPYLHQWASSRTPSKAPRSYWPCEAASGSSSPYLVHCSCRLQLASR